MPNLNNYRVYFSRGVYNCATHQPAGLVHREYMDVEAFNNRDAVNTVFDELAEEMQYIRFYLIVDRNAPTYRGWEAYARPNDHFRAEYGLSMAAERIFVFDDFKVVKRRDKNEKTD